MKKISVEKSSVKKSSVRPGGFISIIAIGVFALLMIFAISLQLTVMDTYQNLTSGNNYGSSQAIADSTIEYLQWKSKNLAAGLNDNVNCVFNKGELDNTKSSGNVGVCDEFKSLTQGKNVTVNLTVKGRSADADKLKTAKCGSFAANCYVVPIPGTGDAGKNCEMYKANVTVQENTNVVSTLTNSVVVDQVNYSCNWNRLKFGSGQTDRVAVPLYYEKAGLSGESTIVNPYRVGADGGQATNLIVRMRTPCVPCGSKLDSGQVRVCDATVVDETVCEDKERYVLDATVDDIVVQWLINGECDVAGGGGKKETCGMMPTPKNPEKLKVENDPYSALYESKIFPSSYIVINNSSVSYDTNNYPKTVTLLKTNQLDALAKPKLLDMYKPILSLFLSKPLLTKSGMPVPYLEYQILTDKPVGNNKSTLEATVIVDGNFFTKTLTKEVPKPLIDFAIHN